MNNTIFIILISHKNTDKLYQDCVLFSLTDEVRCKAEGAIAASMYESGYKGWNTFLINNLMKPEVNFD